MQTIINCVGDGASINSVIDCVVGNGTNMCIHIIKYRIYYLACIRALELLRLSRKTYVRLDKELAKRLRKSARGRKSGSTQ